MIAKISLLLAAVAVAQATLIAPGLLNTGILSPGLLNSGIVSPRLLNAGIVSPGWLGAGLVGPAAVRTGSVVSIPGAVSTDSRLIGAAPGVIAGAPLLANGVIANSLLANGLIGAPIGYRTGLLTSNGIVKTIL